MSEDFRHLQEFARKVAHELAAAHVGGDDYVVQERRETVPHEPYAAQAPVELGGPGALEHRAPIGGWRLESAEIGELRRVLASGAMEPVAAQRQLRELWLATDGSLIQAQLTVDAEGAATLGTEAATAQDLTDLDRPVQRQERQHRENGATWRTVAMVAGEIPEGTEPFARAWAVLNHARHRAGRR